MKKFFCIALLTVAVCPRVEAATVIFGFSGQYNSGPLAGQIFSGQISYDDSLSAFTSSSNPLYDQAVYLNSFTGTNLVSFGSGGVGSNVIQVTNSRGTFTNDAFNFSHGHYNLVFSGAYTSFSGVSLPTFSQLNALQKTFVYNPSGGINFSSGSFTISQVAAVPEPATWAMMLLGFGFVGGAIRSAKRRQRLAISYG